MVVRVERRRRFESYESPTLEMGWARPVQNQGMKNEEL